MKIFIARETRIQPRGLEVDLVLLLIGLFDFPMGMRV
jgi:hypothetical protein